MRAVLVLALLLLPATAWAAIRPVQAEIAVTDIHDVKQAGLDLDIRDTSGRVVYQLACHSGDFEDDRHEYSGLMHCYLNPPGKPHDPNLLNPAGSNSRNWDSRARFLPNEILDACAAYPDWGRVRRFRVGDMLLTLSFSDIIQTTRDAEPSGYHFRVAARPMTAAERARLSLPERPQPTWFGSSSCS